MSGRVQFAACMQRPLSVPQILDLMAEAVDETKPEQAAMTHLLTDMQADLVCETVSYAAFELTSASHRLDGL